MFALLASCHPRIGWPPGCPVELPHAVAQARLYPPAGEASPQDLQVRLGHLGEHLLCARPMEARDLQRYGWVVEYPGELLAWVVTQVGTEKELRERLRTCDVTWGGQIVFYEGSQIIEVTDPRFSSGISTICTIGSPYTGPDNLWQ